MCFQCRPCDFKTQTDICIRGLCNVHVDIISKSQRCMTQPIAVWNVSNTWLRLSWFATARGVWLPRTLSQWKLNCNDAANYHKGNHFQLAEDIRHKMNKCNNQCKHNGHLTRGWGCRRVLHNYTTHPYICGQYSNRPPVQSYRSISLTSRPRIPHSWWSWAGEGGACCHAWVQCSGLTYGNSYGSIILSTTVSD